MEHADAQRLMLLLAGATPLLALLARAITAQAARWGGEPPPPALRRNLWLLAAAGPAMAVSWWMFDRWLDVVGPRSVVGYVLAALTFVAAGFATGYFGRLHRQAREGRKE